MTFAGLCSATAKYPSSDGNAIDIGERRHNRLNDIAAQVRASNTDPVAPSERMYPIHLIQIAIDFLLDGFEIDWNEIQKPEDLRELLNNLRIEKSN